MKRSCIFTVVTLNRRWLELKSEFRSNLLSRWTPGTRTVILLAHTRGRHHWSITRVFFSVPGCSFSAVNTEFKWWLIDCSRHVRTRLSPLIWSQQLYRGKEQWKWPSTTRWQVLWPRPACRCFTPKSGSKNLLVPTLNLSFLCLRVSATPRISVSFSFFEPLSTCLLSDHLWAAGPLFAHRCFTVPPFSCCVA